MERNLEYIRQLEERNRYKKRLSSKSKGMLVNEELERGFSTLFSGANESSKDRRINKSGALKRAINQRAAIATGRKMNVVNDCETEVMGKSKKNDVDDSTYIGPNGKARRRRGWDFHCAKRVDDVPGTADNNIYPTSVAVSGRVVVRHEHDHSSKFYEDNRSSNEYELDDFEEEYSSDGRDSVNPEGVEQNDNESSSTLRHSDTDDVANKTKHLLMLEPANNLTITPDNEGRVTTSRNSEHRTIYEQIISNLDDDQKAELFQALRKDLKTDDTLFSTPMPHFPSGKKNAIMANLAPPTVPNPNPTSSLTRTITEVSRQELLHEVQTEDEQSLSRHVPYDPDSTTKCFIKIRIHSNWSSESKWTSLRAIRIRQFFNPNPEQKRGLERGAFRDILAQNFNFSVVDNSSMQPFPISSESLRYLPYLTNGILGSSSVRSCGTGIVRVSDQLPSLRVRDLRKKYSEMESGWRAPMHNGNGLDILIDGLIDESCCIQVLLWNAMQCEDAISTTAPAKEIDIFVGQKCIWSGELPFCTNSMNTEYQSSSTSHCFLFEDEDIPQLVINLSDECEVIELACGQPELNSIVFDKGLRKDETEPSWLQDLKSTSEQRRRIEAEITSSNVIVHPSLDDIIKSQEHTTTYGDVHESCISKKDESNSNSSFFEHRRKPIVRRRGKLPDFEKNSGGENGDDDSNLRKSMDSLQFAEKQNLGRLKASACATERSGEKNIPFSDSIKEVDITEFPKNPVFDRNVFSEKDKILGAEQKSQRNFNESIKKKIDFINQSILSTIHGLDEAGLLKETGKEVSSILSSKVHDTDLALPSGKLLRIHITATWGDENYVGLNGIELYDENGGFVSTLHEGGNSIEEGAFIRSSYASIETISATPTGLNALSGYENDPRIVDNILDGVNFTKNDLHMWLAPHNHLLDSTNDRDEVAVIDMEFDTNVRLSMVRIFNYNKSRTHNQRGIRKCWLELDGIKIFEGEIKKASGTLNSVEEESHLIDFTSKLTLLDRLRKHKSAQGICISDADESKNMTSEQRDSFSISGSDNFEREELLEDSILMTSIGLRPRTAAGGITRDVILSCKDQYNAEHETSNLVEGSLSESTNNLLEELTRENASLTVIQVPEKHKSISKEVVDTAASCGNFDSMNSSFKRKCRSIKIIFESTWGDTNYIGLSGLQFLIGSELAPLSADFIQGDGFLIESYPCRDLNSIGLASDDPRLLENLFNDCNNTTDDAMMWLVPFKKLSVDEQYLKITFPFEMPVAGIRFWNYNKSLEGISRGCKNISIHFDDNFLCRCILRPAPGWDGLFFPQRVIFDEIEEVMNHKSLIGINNSRLIYRSPAVNQDYETLHLPTAQLWTFTFFDNWNDHYYIGLNAIELYDDNGKLIDVLHYFGAFVTAVPSSVRDLSISTPIDMRRLVDTDPRIPDKLFTPRSSIEVDDAQYCWLSPLARCMTRDERIAAVQKVKSELKQHLNNMNGPSYQLPKENVLVIAFNYPVTLSAIRFFNYQKDPERGVKDFKIDADGKCVYMGSLCRADNEKTGLCDRGNQISRGQTILFSNDNKLITQFKDTINYCGMKDQDVLCINERQVMVRSKQMYNETKPNVALEGIEADLDKRPMTSLRKN